MSKVRCEEIFTREISNSSQSRSKDTNGKKSQVKNSQYSKICVPPSLSGPNINHKKKELKKIRTSKQISTSSKRKCKGKLNLTNEGKTTKERKLENTRYSKISDSTSLSGAKVGHNKIKERNTCKRKNQNVSTCRKRKIPKNDTVTNMAKEGKNNKKHISEVNTKTSDFSHSDEFVQPSLNVMANSSTRTPTQQTIKTSMAGHPQPNCCEFQTSQ